MGAFLLGSGSENATPNHEAEPALAAPTQRVAGPQSPAIPELNEAALRAIRREGLQIRRLGSGQPDDDRHVIPRARILDDARHATAASLARITNPDYRDASGLRIIDNRLAWVVIRQKHSVPMIPSGPAPRSNTEVRLRKQASPAVFDSASAVVIIDATTGRFLQAESISLR